ADGMLTLNADGSFSYTPNANFYGTDSFTYRASDGRASSDPATVAITVNPVNDVPVAVLNGYSVEEDNVLSVGGLGVLENDTDVEGDALTAVLVTAPSRGVLALIEDGTFSYTPNANFNGTDAFTYRAYDGLASSSISTVTITVEPVNDAPEAQPDAHSGNEDATLVVATPGVLENDTDVDGNPVTAVLASGPASGTLTLNADGSFRYTPNANFNGTDSFTYRASDGVDSSALATVTITVNPANDTPVAAADTYGVNEDGVLTVAVPGVLGNDLDVEGDTLSTLLVGLASSGTLALNADGSFSYAPNASFNGVDSFSYRAYDGLAYSDVVAVTITVTAVNDAPSFTASNPPAINEDAGLQTIAGWASFKPGPVDESDQSVLRYIVSLISGPDLFDVVPSVAADGTLTYALKANAFGTSTFEVAVQDDGGTDDGGIDTSTPQTFTITVVGLPVAPSGVDLLPSSDTGASTSDNLTNLDNSVSDKTLGFLVSGTVAGATVTVYGDGTPIGSALATNVQTIVMTNGNADLVDGLRVITARQTEPGKAESTDSPALPITVDTVGPRVTALDPSPGAVVTRAQSVVATFDEALSSASVGVDSFKVSSDRGADALWGTSDDTYVAGTVSYNAAARQATFSASSALPYDEYRVILKGGASIMDVAGNRLDGEFSGVWPSGDGASGGDFAATFTVKAEAEVMELSSASRRMEFRDSDGDTVTVGFSGQGTATITRSEAAGQPGDIETIVFDGTDSRTGLTITVREKTGRNANDGTTVQTISGDGIGTLNMKNVDLVGNGINLAGALKRLVVDDIADGTEIILGGSADAQITITADQVGNVGLTFPGVLKSGTVTRWAGGTIQVGRLDNLVVRNGALGAGIESNSVVGKVTVTNGDLSGDIQADRVGTVSVKYGDLTGSLFARNVSGQMRTPALDKVTVTGGDIAGSIRVENNGNVGSISAKTYDNAGGSVGDDDGDTILIAGQVLKSITADRDIRAAITVENESGTAKGNALGLVKAIGGSLFGAVQVLNNGNLGTVQAKRIRADVTVAGKANLVWTELDNVVAAEPQSSLATIILGGKGKVRGKNGTIPVGDEGGKVYVVVG
ncbi:MAG: tandem-95 repeat protein, partial [Planctomycetes bacterium]|nr:tandem-95 repeat protein [Planctomycetota bacterium]